MKMRFPPWIQNRCAGGGQACGCRARAAPRAGHGNPRWVPAIPLVASLAAYAATISADIGWGDSAELALQAQQLGVTHAPGYPVHTLLGKLFTLLFSEPAIGTNWLSAVCTSLAVGVLSLLVLRLTADRFAGLVGPLLFAFCSVVWVFGTITEIYNVNVLLVGSSFYLLVIRQEDPSMARPVAAAAVFGLSLGTSLANFLLLPAFLFLAAQSSPRRWTGSLIFLGVAGVLGVLVLSWTVLRSASSPPLGTAVLPTSIDGAIAYFGGAQYGASEFPGAADYFVRLADHVKFLARNFGFVGVAFALIGVPHLWRARRPVCIASLLLFAVNFGYFTGYGAEDYVAMVAPSYFVVALWCCVGVHALTQPRRPRLVRILTHVSLLGVLSWMLVSQLQTLAPISRSTAARDMAVSALRNLPPDAVAVAAWGNFTPLTYVQRTRRIRDDLTVIELTNETRHYRHGAVHGWMKYLDALPPARRVFVPRRDLRYLVPMARQQGRDYRGRPFNKEWVELVYR